MRDGKRVRFLCPVAVLVLLSGFPRLSIGGEPDTAGTAIERAIGMALRGHPDEAEGVLLPLLTATPRDAAILGALGNVALIRGQLDLAVSYYNAAIYSSGTDPGLYGNLAYALWLRGDRAGALQAARRAVDLAGTLDQALAVLGLADAGAPVKEAAGGAFTRSEARELIERGASSGDSALVAPDQPPVQASKLDEAAPIVYWRQGGTDRQTPAPAAVSLERFPSIHAPDRVRDGEPFAVEISLTTAREQPGTIELGDSTSVGAMKMVLPTADSWAIDVVLSAPAFDILDRNTGVLVLRREGNSTPALFKLHLRPAITLPSVFRVTANFYHRGAFLAQVSRGIFCAPAGTAQPNDTELPPPSSARTIPFAPGLAAPDLTVCMGIPDPAHPQQREVTITSPHWQWPRVETFSMPDDFRDWLEGQFAAATGRNLRGVAAPKRERNPADAQDRARLRGLGRELYRKFSPPGFQRALWELQDQLGDQFVSIQICSDDPSIPWELMVPTRDSGTPSEMEYLGLRYWVGRWHLDPTRNTATGRPVQVIPVREVVAIAPEYRGQAALEYQAAELRALQALPGYRRLEGNVSAVSNLCAALPQGILHFAGHGEIHPAGEHAVEYTLVLEDAPLNLMTWRGLLPAQPVSHPLVFLNACDLGRSNRIANFVDGWAPAALEAGAGGYIGGLWPLSDPGASRFAQKFYMIVQEGLRSGPVTVAQALARTRREYETTNDPTYLAYVYYGDPLATLSSQPR